MRSLTLAGLFFLLESAGHHGGMSKKIMITGFAQGTSYHITYYAADSLVTKQQVDSVLNSIDSSLSIYKSYSLINRFNNDVSGITMDGHFKKVVQQSLKTCKATGGLFDITVQPLVAAWGFGLVKTDTLPSAATVQAIVTCVSSAYLKIKQNRLVKSKPCVKIDVNGIAQGYSVDVLAEFLEQRNIHNYLVEIGGEIRVKGRKQPGGEKMKIGIESPGEDELTPGLMQQIIELDHGAITTSGSYRKFYENDGKKITHIINPKTGYPVQNDVISVAVYAKDAVTADAYDNALMLMGWQKGLQFVEKKKGLAAYYIYRDAEGMIRDTASRNFYKLIAR